MQLPLCSYLTTKDVFFTKDNNKNLKKKHKETAIILEILKRAISSHLPWDNYYKNEAN